MSQPRSFTALRGQEPPKKPVDPDAIDQVLGRIAGTRDGQLMLAWLRAECQATSVPAASDAMLREAEGKRRAYGDLIRLSAPTA